MWLQQPSPELLSKIQKIRKENLDTRDRDVEIIKTWLLEQPHLPDSWAKEDLRLLNFLRGSDFSIELCKKKLDKYFTVRATIPDFFANRDINRPELQEILRIGDFAILPDLTPDGRRVCMTRAAQPDFETPNFSDIAKLTFMIGDIRLEHEVECIDGDIYIFDINYPLAKHFFKVSLLAIRKFLICAQEAYPVLVKQVHLINAPAFVGIVISVVKPFLSESFRNAIKVHSNIDTLYEFVPKELLPEDYGGKGKKMIEYKNAMLKTVEQYQTWFKEQEDVKSDEKKRVGRFSSNRKDLKQLNID